MKNTSVSSGSRNLRIFFVLLAVCLTTVLPAYFSWQADAQDNPPGTSLFARLTGEPVGNRIPHGFGNYFENSGNRVLDVSVDNIGLPGGTMLGVFVNGASVGQIELSTHREGRLRLSTMAGHTVPTVVGGSTLAVKNGEMTILSGTFASPSPSPSPSGTRTPHPSPSPHSTPALALHAPLTGDVIGGVMPRGVSLYAEFTNTSRRLRVFVNHVNLPEGTTLDVSINGASVGQITLNNEGKGRLLLDTANGGNIPTIVAGTPIAVKNGETTILAGTFRTNTHPTPSPTVSPTPHPNRRFVGRLNGAQVVPPVTTEARGSVAVVLNQAETQVQVHLGFAHLSSNQTTAAIYAPAMAGETAPVIFNLGTIGGTNGRFTVQTFDVTAEQVQQLRNGLWYVQIASVDNPSGEIRGQIRSRSHHGGFNGAGGDDIAVFRPSDGTWYIKNGIGLNAFRFGQNGDVPVSGDFDGDGKTDVAVFRNGYWYILRSSDGGFTARHFGTNGDLPVRGDYDGDGLLDLAVFRPSNGTWYIQKSNGTGFIYMPFGFGSDRPVAADFDGDGKTDIAVFRPSNGAWYWLKSSTGEFRAVNFGMNGDIPIAGDFDGDGVDDITVFRPSNGFWYIWKSSDERFDFRHFGMSGDIPVAGNYDADGKDDIAVFRPSNGSWYIWRSSDGGYDSYRFGSGGDIPATKQ